ncbi:hypothetical protein NQD34_017487 [Periophthalmus magnuspinnatus]|nr:hypothetical protein NQD34_017487 [Periophthalmus magnuspinnatus]
MALNQAKLQVRSVEGRARIFQGIFEQKIEQDKKCHTKEHSGHSPIQRPDQYVFGLHLHLTQMIVKVEFKNTVEHFLYHHMMTSQGGTECFQFERRTQPKSAGLCETCENETNTTPGLCVTRKQQIREKRNM